MVDDEHVSLDPDVENHLRRQLDTINTQLGGDRPDRFIIERSIRLIVEQLASIGQLGKGARRLLEDLGVEPDELVETTIDGPTALVDTNTSSWGEPNQAQATAPVEQAGRQAETLTADLERAVETHSTD